MLRYLLLFLPLLLMGEVVPYPVAWTARNCKEIGQSPLGKIYLFPDSEKYTLLHPNFLFRNFTAHRKNCDCTMCEYLRQTVDGGVLETKLPEKKIKAGKKRFLTVSFKIRLFPALSTKKTCNFSILFYDSEHQITGSSYTRLHGLTSIHHGQMSPFYSSTTTSLTLDKFYMEAAFHPSFQPLAIRIIYDMQKGQRKLCINQQSLPFAKIEDRTFLPMKMSKFAISTSYRNTHTRSARRIGHRMDYLEVSNPIIHLCDTEEELKSLPKMEFHPYPYQNYTLESRKKKLLSEQERFKTLLRHDNPDLQYAYALRYLYGSIKECDPAKGLELLEKAAKKRHVSALYELGVCYFRGYGVEPDFRKAKRYLKDSAEYDYSNADALSWLIDFTAAGKPWFSTKQLSTQASKMHGNMREHDAAYTRNALSPMVSPKLLKCSIAQHLEKADGSKVKYLDAAAKMNYYPAYFYQVLWDLKHEKSLDECIALLRTACKGNSSFYPTLLRYEFQKSKTLPTEFFTVQKSLRYRDDPLYALFSFYLKNPKFPQLEKFLSSKSLDRIPIPDWVKINSPEADLLQGLALMAQFQYKRHYSYAFPKLEEAFGALQRAALKNNPTALYWLGRSYYYNDLPEKIQKQEKTLDARTWKAKNYLARAEKMGNYAASLLMTEIELNSRSANYTAIISRMEKFCKVKEPKGFELQAQAMRRLGSHAQANQICKKGIEAGNYILLRDLALYEKQKNNTTAANQYWYRFIQADRKARTEDIDDFYWPDPFSSFYQWRTSSELVKSQTNKKLVLPDAR